MIQNLIVADSNKYKIEEGEINGSNSSSQSIPTNLTSIHAVILAKKDYFYTKTVLGLYYINDSNLIGSGEVAFKYSDNTTGVGYINSCNISNGKVNIETNISTAASFEYVYKYILIGN